MGGFFEAMVGLLGMLWCMWQIYYYTALEENFGLKIKKFICTVAGIYVIMLVMEHGAFFMVLLLVVIELYFIRANAVQKDNQMLTIRDEAARQQYQEYADYYEKNRQLIHDMKNHLFILKKCAENGEYEQLQQYLDEIGEVYLEPKFKIQSGNWMLDNVLNQKKAAADQKEIAFQSDLCRNLNLPFSNTEICALFGNLLDNSIEACEKIEDPKNRFIRLKIEHQGKMLHIEIANSTAGDAKIKNGELETTKKEDGLHGIGIRSVKRVVKKYDGILTNEIRENVFRVCISFFE